MVARLNTVTTTATSPTQNSKPSTPELSQRRRALREEQLRRAERLRLYGGPEGIAAFARKTFLESPDEPEGEVPFEAFDYQIEFWAALLEECGKLDRGERTDVIHDEKSRQVGITWAGGLFILWTMWLWRFSWRALVLSYNEDLVDDGGSKSTTDSLFGKVRFMWERLPDDLRPPLEFRLGRIWNTRTGATVVGKSTAPTSKQSGGGGRGGSYRYGFWDEAAFGAHSFQVYGGFLRAVRVACLWSTPNGKANIHGWLKFRAKGGVRYLRQHWTQHPIYGEGKELVNGKWTSPWYEAECQRMTAEDIARELDIGYEASVKGRAFPEFSVDVHVQEGVSYQGGKLFAGLDPGVRATAMSLHEARTGVDGVLEIVTIAAAEFEGATADVIAEALKGWQRFGPLRIFADPAGRARTQTTGTSIIDELAGMGLQIDASQRLRDVRRRVRTVRLLLAGKEINGRPVRYVCGSPEDDPGLAWFAESIEQAAWPTDQSGVVRGEPSDLADNEYTHHADAFGYAIEGFLGGADIAVPAANEHTHKPVFAGMRNRRF
jgi:hypothetical protein